MRKSMPKTASVVFIDAFISSVSLIFALLMFSIDGNTIRFDALGYLWGVLILCIVLCTVYYLFGLYRIMWQYAGAAEGLTFAAATVFAFLVFMVIHMAFMTEIIRAPRFDFWVYFFSAFISFFLLFGFRLFFGWRAKKRIVPAKSGKKVMIIGAGSAGNMLMRDMLSNEAFERERVVCLIDDDPAKIGKTLHGVSVVGSRDTIVENAKKHKIDKIVVAIPSASAAQRAKIYEICTKTGCEVATLPSLDRMLSERGTAISKLRRVNVEDLLGREPIDIDVESIVRYVENQVILVTGGGGSIGSELCRQLAKHKPKRLIIFDVYENNAYDILNELRTDHPELDVRALIGTVRDEGRLEEIFAEHRPDIVYHAAAHKHVPLMEESPREAIKNNVFGTRNTVLMADKYGAKKFLLISTDKAVNPTNIMGASKRICEMIVQDESRRSKTEFMIVRFGNVLGSNGSVIPLFEKQIENGGPVTVTDERVIRYFMTIPEAVSLVLEAGALAKGGEIFVLDMGKPMKILELAENLIRLSGYEPYRDIDIEFTGLRPGEKLYEELLMAEEGLLETDNQLIYIGKPIDIDEGALSTGLEELERATKRCDGDIKKEVAKIVPTYIPQ